MRFYVTATKPNRKRPYGLTVGADSVADIPRAIGPGFTITEVLDRDRKVVPDWRTKISSGEVVPPEEKSHVAESSPRAREPKAPNTK